MIEFTQQPHDVAVAAGETAFFPCVIASTSATVVSIPEWNITLSNTTKIYPRRNLPSGFIFNGTGLLVAICRGEWDRFYFSCCLTLLDASMSTFNTICSEAGQLNIFIATAGTSGCT